MQRRNQDEESHYNRRAKITLISDNLGLGLSLKHIGTNATDNLTTTYSIFGFSCEGKLIKI